MLSRDDDGFKAPGLPIGPVDHRDLRFAVREDKGDGPGFAGLCELVGQLIRKGDGQRHEVVRLIAGVAEHHTLVPSTQQGLFVLGAAFLHLHGAGHAHGNVRALAVDAGQDSAGVPVKAGLRAVVAHLADGLPDQLGDVHIAVGGDFPSHYHQPGGGEGLAGHPAGWVLPEHGVQHSVGDPVAELVGVAFRNGLRCEQVLHLFSSLSPE